VAGNGQAAWPPLGRFSLITAWHNHLAPNAESLGAGYPMLLPLPGAASDTDHAG
jgi:hypothetical protein